MKRTDIWQLIGAALIALVIILLFVWDWDKLVDEEETDMKHKADGLIAMVPNMTQMFYTAISRYELYNFVWNEHDKVTKYAVDSALDGFLRIPETWTFQPRMNLVFVYCMRDELNKILMD